jgi:hypothetical protein
MRYRRILAVAALVFVIVLQPVCRASAHAGTVSVSVHLRQFSSHHSHQMNQPVPRQATGTVNVKDFGATGNGSTDDTGAIQNAIAAAHAGGLGVLFPAGTYLHASVITANSVPLIGVGGATTLLANNATSTAVILTGVSPSIQNMVVNSAPASSGATDTTPTHATVLVQSAQNFVVQGITIVQGVGRVGVYLQQSAVGQVAAVTFNGTGSNQDLGIIVDGCANTSLLGNLMLNEGTAITLGGFSPFICYSIAIISNTISNAMAGIILNTLSGGITNILDIEQNQIQLVTTNAAVSPLQVNNSANNYSITQNTFSGGILGMFVANPANFTGVVAQNTIRNCNQYGAIIATTSGGGLQFLSNKFGECGIVIGGSAVILAIPQGGPDTMPILNNIYEGHTNLLTNYIFAIFHLSTVAGNAQTQTALPNSIP